FSSVSIVGGKIYTMGSFANETPVAAEKKEEPKADSKDPRKKKKRAPVNETTAVLALDASGKILWKTNISPTGDGGGYHGPRCTPTVDEGHVYALSDVGDLVCLDAENGKEIWRVNFPKDLGGKMMSGWGYAESPTIDGDKVICSPGGKNGTLAALDKKTGKVIWRSKDFTDSASYASLVPAEIGGTHQYVVLTDADVAGIGADGSLLWKAPRKGATAVVATPVVKDNLVFVSSGYGIGCNQFKVEGSSTALTAAESYANKDMKVHHGGLICLGDYVYGSNDPGILTCMSIKDGSVAWKDRSVGKGSLAYADGRLYLRAEGSGTVALVDASPEGYKELGQLKQPDRSHAAAWPHPVIAGGKLYLRDQDVLLCYDIKAK
ncbi:MAG TPA: PQQ-binding-like beta-propeller repeat protein, partial [Humisphaera sp.]|nr:PQQ-binding-like beta-propeller repeat protein [Humisphaera sp.]